MSAPVGNQFWKLGEQTGRPRLFNSPDELWEAATSYFQWCDDHPLQTYEWNGKDPVKCDLEKMRAYTWSGLEYYLGIDSLREYKTTYKEFSHIITRIEKVIYTQKFEGAAAGLLNPNIIARDLGLVDKQAVDANVTGVEGFVFAPKTPPASDK